MTALRDPVAILTTGPVPAYPAVLRAMARPIAYDHDPTFQAFYEATARKAARALRTPDPPVILHMEAAPALEACLASLVHPSDVVLSLVTGPYGAAMATLCRRYTPRVVELAVPFDRVVAPDQVAAALAEHAATSIITVAHHETPSGTLNPVNAIGRIARAHGALLMVDAVSSFGGVDVDPVACNADMFVASPGKCLGGTPGLSMVAVSAQAWDHITANAAAPRASVLSLLDWREAWKSSEPFPFTPSIAEVHGLDAALDLYLAEGPQAVWRRHEQAARICRAGIRGLGLELWPAREEDASATTTVVRLPEPLRGEQVLRIARAKLGVALTPGRGAAQASVVRIAHMGVTAEPAFAILAVAAIATALRDLGVAHDLLRGMDAAFGELARSHNMEDRGAR